MKTTVVPLEAGQVTGVLEGDGDVDVVAEELDEEEPEEELAAEEESVEEAEDVLGTIKLVAEVVLEVVAGALLVVDELAEEPSNLAPETAPFEIAGPTLDLR